MSKSAVRIKPETAGRGAGRGAKEKRNYEKQRRQKQLCHFYNGVRIIIVTLTFESLFSARLANAEFMDQPAASSLLNRPARL